MPFSAASLTMMGGMGRSCRLEWSALEPATAHAMPQKGITDWQIFHGAARGAVARCWPEIKAIPLPTCRPPGLRGMDRDKAVSRLLGRWSTSPGTVGGTSTRAKLNQGARRAPSLAWRAALPSSKFPFAMVSAALDAGRWKPNEAGHSALPTRHPLPSA